MLPRANSSAGPDDHCYERFVPLERGLVPKFRGLVDIAVGLVPFVCGPRLTAGKLIANGRRVINRSDKLDLKRHRVIRTSDKLISIEHKVISKATGP